MTALNLRLCYVSTLKFICQRCCFATARTDSSFPQFSVNIFALLPSFGIKSFELRSQNWHSFCSQLRYYINLRVLSTFYCAWIDSFIPQHILSFLSHRKNSCYSTSVFCHTLFLNKVFFIASIKLYSSPPSFLCKVHLAPSSSSVVVKWQIHRMISR